MFERFTEQARRTIFFARYEASQFGSTQIESEHLLLGLIREDETLKYGLLTVEARKNICLAVESHSKDSTILSVNIDLPLSRECVQILKNAAEQADQHSNNHIGTEHLLLALLPEETDFQPTATLELARRNLARLGQHHPPQVSLSRNHLATLM